MRSVILASGLALIVLAIFSTAWAGHGHQGYFQYANVPAYGQYEFGYHRGNPYHYTSRYEQGHNWRFRTKVRWGDKAGGYGEHYYDYNHVDKGHKGGHKGHGWGHGGGHGGGHGHGHGFSHGHGHGHGGHHHGSYSEQVPQVMAAAGSNNIDNNNN